MGFNSGFKGLRFYIVLLTSFPTNVQKLINFKRLVHEIIITP